MKIKMYKYPSIPQLRNVIKQIVDSSKYVGRDENNNAIFDNTITPPTLKFKAKVKSHGTNASIVLNRNGDYYMQSRERVLSLEADNAGFYVYGKKVQPYVEPLLKKLLQNSEFDAIAVYGEWCGGSIQSKVALNKLDRMFIVFDVIGLNDTVINGEDSFKRTYLYNDIDSFLNEELKIYNINLFDSHEVEINFDKPHLIVDEIIKKTIECEEYCPIGKYFGVEGVGEGWVYSLVDNTNFNEKIQFKSKGEKHQSSRVKKLVEVDVEKIENVNKFVEYALTESRLQQGIQYLNEMQIDIDVKNTGDYVRWIIKDVIKEESDTLVENGLSSKDVNSKLGNVARNYFIKYCNSNY